MISSDTIVAISSAVGPAARMIVRMSGPAAVQLGVSLLSDPSRLLHHGQAISAELRLHGLNIPATFCHFQSPRSYTGDDLIEFHLPGNPLLATWLLEALLSGGARMAEAGEFTARAYLSGKLDLTEAEGVAAAIHANSEQELRAARQLLSGELARRLRPAMDLLADTLALIEVGIDFVEEDVTFLSSSEIADRILQLQTILDEISSTSRRFESLTHEPRIVLAGRPNAGKSTLLNALAGRDRAVVSPVAGTTRDAVSAEVVLPRGIARMIDVAGLEDDTPDGAAAWEPLVEIERQMRDRALSSVETADLVVLVCDPGDKREVLSLARNPDLVVWTKADLHPTPIQGGIGVSARTGKNMNELRLELDRLAFGPAAPAASTLCLNTRHVQLIGEAQAALGRAGEVSMKGGEFVALELREALDALGRILGQVSPDDLLGRIFATFCIGK